MNGSTRRQFLKFGAALPLAMHSLNLRAEAKPESAPPRRIMFICNSLGFYKPYFFPKKRGDLATSPYLKEIATKDKLTVFENLYHPGMETSNHDSEKSFLTGVPKPEAPNFANSISLDQVLVQHMGGGTRFPFLPLSIYDRGWGCSWNDRGVAIPPLHDVKLKSTISCLAKKTFPQNVKQIEKDQHVRQVACLKRDMRTNGNPSRESKGSATSKIETYRNVIAELEKQTRTRILLAGHRRSLMCPDTLSDDPEFAFSTKIEEPVETVEVRALQTDSTRVITLSLDWIYGAIKVPGATGGWHTLSHHGGQAGHA